MSKSFVVAITVVYCAVSSGTASSWDAKMGAIDALGGHTNQLEGLTDTAEPAVRLAGLTPTTRDIQDAVLEPQLLRTAPVQQLGVVGDLSSVLAANYVSASRQVVPRAESPRLAGVGLMIVGPALLAGLAGLLIAVIRRSA